MKKLIAFCVVLAVACSSVFALSGISSLFSKQPVESSASSVEEVEVPEVEPVELVPVVAPTLEEAKNSTKNVEKTSNPLSDLLTNLDSKKKLTSKELAAHKDNLKAVAEDMDALIEDSEKKDAYLSATHPFVNAGVGFGFGNNQSMVFGAVLGGGLKFRNGITVAANLQYDMFAVAKVPQEDGSVQTMKVFDAAYDKTKLHAMLTVGYEW